MITPATARERLGKYIRKGLGVRKRRLLQITAATAPLLVLSPAAFPAPCSASCQPGQDRHSARPIYQRSTAGSFSGRLRSILRRPIPAGGLSRGSVFVPYYARYRQRGR